MKIYKWCVYGKKGDWLLTHQAFLRPEDIVWIDGNHFKVVSMPYRVNDLIEESDEWSIDLEPIKWKD